jgi:hypothetical protein
MARKKGVWRLVTIAEAAREYDMAYDRMRNLIRRSQIPAYPSPTGNRRSKVVYRATDIKLLMIPASLPRAS